MEKNHVLNDAARQLRVAARLLDKMADTYVTTDANTVDIHARSKSQVKRLSEANANINAALARMKSFGE